MLCLFIRGRRVATDSEASEPVFGTTSGARAHYEVQSMSYDYLDTGLRVNHSRLKARLAVPLSFSVPSAMQTRKASLFEKVMWQFLSRGAAAAYFLSFGL